MVGKELVKERKRAGLTQEKLAHKAGVHRTYISLLERDVKSPTLDVFLRICAALRVSPSRIIARLEKKKR
ncbi:MAG: XRE family transcriptional regulator [Planctomycetota bacterium]|nr:MAG: XRE family transcriptional regulator [Planctomycetota bacterium]